MPSFSRCSVPALVLTCAVVSAGCFSDYEDATGLDEPVVEVSATNQNRFQAPTVTVRVGESVRWRNTGGVFHTVTFDPGRADDPANVELPGGVQPFNSDLGAGMSFSRRFTVAGTYRYICEPHEALGMVGTVIVTP